MNEKRNVQNNTGGNNYNLPRYLKLLFYRIPNPLKGCLILSTNILQLRTNIFSAVPLFPITGTPLHFDPAEQSQNTHFCHSKPV